MFERIKWPEAASAAKAKEALLSRAAGRGRAADIVRCVRPAGLAQLTCRLAQALSRGLSVLGPGRQPGQRVAVQCVAYECC